MKSDSSLLNQRKPFFLPEWSEEIMVVPTLVVRIGRLGKHIQEKFASRYWDAIALGLDFRAEDKLREGQWAEGLAFDDSLAVGEWMPPTTAIPEDWQPCVSIEEAIATISRHMILRTGDTIYIDTLQPAMPAQREMVFRYNLQDQENLYCKIK